IPEPDFLWLDAADPATVVTDGMGNVIEWQDKSARGLVAVVGANVAPPVIHGASPSGLSAISFVDPEERLVTASVPTAEQMTLFVVFRNDLSLPWGSLVNQGHETYFSIRRSESAVAAGRLTFQVRNNDDEPS